MIYNLPEYLKKLGKPYTTWISVLLLMAYSFLTMNVAAVLYYFGISFYVCLQWALQLWVLVGLGGYFLLKSVKKKE